MSDNPVVRGYLLDARAELKTAKILVASEDPDALRFASYHLQQIAENDLSQYATSYRYPGTSGRRRGGLDKAGTWVVLEDLEATIEETARSLGYDLDRQP